MKMSKIASLFASALVAVSLTACGGAKTENAEGENAETEKTELTPQQQRMMKGLEEELGKINEQLPMETGDGLTLTKMEVKDGYLISTCTYAADNELEVDTTPEGKANIIKAAGASSITRLKQLNLGLKYIYEAEGSGKSQEIVITPEEL